MLHPSYTELMETINNRAEEEGTPVINSRYSIVIAAAKRARQIIEKTAEDEDAVVYGKKPLSMAVDELMSGEVKIVENDIFDDDDDDMIQTSSVYGVAMDTEDGEDMDYSDDIFDEEESDDLEDQDEE